MRPHWFVLFDMVQNRGNWLPHTVDLLKVPYFSRKVRTMWIDITFLTIAGFAFYKGYHAGIIKMVFTIVSILIGLLIAMRFAAEVTGGLQRVFNTQHPLLFLVGFLVTFLLVMWLVRWLARKLEDFLETIKLNFINELQGGILYAILATIILASALGLINRAGLISTESREKSMTWPLLEIVPGQAQVVYTKLKPVFNKFWNDSKKAIDGGSDGRE